MSEISQLIERLDIFLNRTEAFFDFSGKEPDWTASAYRWRTNRLGFGYLQSILNPHRVELDSIKNCELQKKRLLDNTRQFVEGNMANNVLLTGARGTGKSSLVKACWNQFSNQSLKIIEVDKSDLCDLIDIVDLIANRPEKFIVFCDDLSFEQGEVSYKALKSVLEGSIVNPSNNMVFYATSNRRHLIPQTMKENLDVSYEEGELRPSDSIEEKVSLSDRFGLWLSFYPFSQDEYLLAAEYWIQHFGGSWNSEVAASALLWERSRGSRSGRVAWQFAKDYQGSRQK
jgi:predicted AAA+ superfamily ATPase